MADVSVVKSITVSWLPLDLNDDKSTLVQVMAPMQWFGAIT